VFFVASSSESCHETETGAKMRLWSLHPKYLDSKGLLAAWREALLAQHVLEGKTRGYQNHPQLIRFKAMPDPVGAINSFLQVIYQEAITRGYNFDKSKIGSCAQVLIPVTTKQVEYEFSFLKTKLSSRDPAKFNLIKDLATIEVAGIFTVVEGEIAEWEKVKTLI